jgi:hypothetical protein
VIALLGDWILDIAFVFFLLILGVLVSTTLILVVSVVLNLDDLWRNTWAQ